MVNFPYRFAFILLSLSPIAIGFFCIGVSTLKDALLAVLYGSSVCAIALFFFRCWLNRIFDDQTETKLTFVSVEKKRSSSSAYFFAYILPIIFSESAPRLMLVLAFFLFLVSSTPLEAEENNPLIRFLGYGFYSITTTDGMTVLLMTRLDASELLQIKEKGLYCVWFDSSFCIQKEY